MGNEKKNKQAKIINVGTGVSSSFKYVAEQIINFLGYGKINYIKFPQELKPGYQSSTKAKIISLRKLGYKKNFTQISNGIKNFTNNIDA